MEFPRSRRPARLGTRPDWVGGALPDDRPAACTRSATSRRGGLVKEGDSLSYVTLMVATGARHHYFGKEEWEQFAPGLKTIEDATNIRRRILLAFETAEREADLERRRACLTFVIVGA